MVLVVTSTWLTKSFVREKITEGSSGVSGPRWLYSFSRIGVGTWLMHDLSLSYTFGIDIMAMNNAEVM